MIRTISDTRHGRQSLTPRECARLMGFESPQGYRVAGSRCRTHRLIVSLVIRWWCPAFAAVARLLEPKIKQAVAIREKEKLHGRRSR